MFGVKNSIEQDILRLQIFYLSGIKVHLGIKNKEMALFFHLIYYSIVQICNQILVGKKEVI